MRYTNCNKCPCLNQDYEQGGSCNLGYDTDLEWYRKSDMVVIADTPEMRSHQKDFELVYASPSCGLKEIILGDGAKFVPDRSLLREPEPKEKS